MSETQTTTTAVPGPLTEIYNRTLLDNLRANLVYKLFASAGEVVPAGSGSFQVKWRRYGKISASTTTLTEGVTPTPTVWTKADITATLLEKGDWVEYSDAFDLQNFSDALDNLIMEMGQAGALSYDTLCRDVVIAGTNIFYAAAVAGIGSVASVAATADLDKIIRTLTAANVPKITQAINASNAIGTVGILPAYVGIVHPNTTITLAGLTSGAWGSFRKVSEYPSATQLLPFEVGSYGPIRFVESSLATYEAGLGANGSTYQATGGAYDVYSTVILGAGAYGSVNLAQAAPEIIVKPLGYGDDPLNQRGSVGWKGWNIDKILDDTRLVVYKHAVAK